MKKIIVILILISITFSTTAFNNGKSNDKSREMNKKQIQDFITNANKDYLKDYDKYLTKTKIGTVDGSDLFLMKGKYENYNDVSKAYEKYYSKDLIPYVVEYYAIINVNGKSAFSYSLGIDRIPIGVFRNIVIKDNIITATVLFDGEFDSSAENYIMKPINGKWVITSINGNTKLRQMKVNVINK